MSGLLIIVVFSLEFVSRAHLGHLGRGSLPSLAIRLGFSLQTRRILLWKASTV